MLILGCFLCIEGSDFLPRGFGLTRLGEMEVELYDASPKLAMGAFLKIESPFETWGGTRTSSLPVERA
jgi:hypothetical protein